MVFALKLLQRKMCVHTHENLRKMQVSSEEQRDTYIIHIFNTV